MKARRIVFGEVTYDEAILGRNHVTSEYDTCIGFDFDPYTGRSWCLFDKEGRKLRDWSQWEKVGDVCPEYCFTTRKAAEKGAYRMLRQMKQSAKQRETA